MKPLKIIVLAGMLIGTSGAAFFAGARAANAATTTVSSPIATASAATTTVSAPAIPSDNCGLDVADVTRITAIRNDPTLTPSQEMAQELSARKQLITRIVACAQADVQSLQSTLTAAPANGDAAAAIKTQLQGRLSDAANFYSIELGKLNGAGIAGSQLIAGDVLAWRAGTYTSLVGQVSNFILWSGNQNLFTTAQSRMGQTQQAVSFLESASANRDLQNAFNAAYASFNTAKNDNASAQAALAQSLPPGQSLTVIKKSLDELSDTYQKFFDVSTIIKTLLPQ